MALPPRPRGIAIAQLTDRPRAANSRRRPEGAINRPPRPCSTCRPAGRVFPGASKRLLAGGCCSCWDPDRLTRSQAQPSLSRSMRRWYAQWPRAAVAERSNTPNPRICNSLPTRREGCRTPSEGSGSRRDPNPAGTQVQFRSADERGGPAKRRLLERTPRRHRALPRRKVQA